MADPDTDICLRETSYGSNLALMLGVVFARGKLLLCSQPAAISPPTDFHPLRPVRTPAMDGHVETTHILALVMPMATVHVTAAIMVMAMIKPLIDPLIKPAMEPMIMAPTPTRGVPLHRTSGCSQHHRAFEP